MPDGCVSIGGPDLHIEQAVAESEQTLEHLRQGEPGAKRLLVEIEAFTTQLFGPVGHVPGGERLRFGSSLACCAGFQFRQLPFRCREGCRAQLFEQRFHGVDIVRHLRGQADVGPVAIAEAFSLFRPEAEDLLDQCTVVEVSIAGPADVGAIDGFAQVTVLSVSQERQIAGHVESQQPGAGGGRGIGFPSLSGRGRQGIQGPWRQAGHLLGIPEHQGPLLGGIQHVIAELGG